MKTETNKIFYKRNVAFLRDFKQSILKKSRFRKTLFKSAKYSKEKQSQKNRN